MIKEVNTLIVSDIHLGARHAKPLKLVSALKKYAFKRLIVLGDLIDSPRVRLDESSKALLKTLNQISGKFETVVIQGNHDGDILPILLDGKSIHFTQEYHWRLAGANHLALHGDQFDSSLKKNAAYIAAIDTIDWAAGVIDRRQLRHKLARRLSWFWHKVATDVGKKAIHFAKQRKVDVVFCGHVHLEHEIDEAGVRYYNTGAWLNQPPSLTTISEEGVIERHWH